MTDLENELRRVFELKGQEVSDPAPPPHSFVWRIRIARATLPALATIVVAAAIVGATTLGFEPARTVVPGPADQENDRPGKNGSLPRREYRLTDTPMYLAPSERGLWVAGFRINHIDLKNDVSASTESLDGAAKGITTGFGRVWIALEREQGSFLIGARATGRRRVTVTDEVAIGGLDNIGNHFLATGHGAVWVTSSDGNVHRYDPFTQEMDTFDISEHFEDYRHSNGALVLAAGDLYMWFATTPGSVVAFDPVTMEPAGPRAELGWNVGELEFGAGRLVVLHTSPRGAHRIWRILEAQPEADPQATRVGTYGSDGVLEVRGTDAYLFRWKSSKTSMVFRLDLKTGRLLRQTLVAKDPYEAFTVQGDYGWLGDLAERKVTRISVPHLLED